MKQAHELPALISLARLLLRQTNAKVGSPSRTRRLVALGAALKHRFVRKGPFLVHPHPPGSRFEYGSDFVEVRLVVRPKEQSSRRAGTTRDRLKKVRLQESVLAMPQFRPWIWKRT